MIALLIAIAGCASAPVQEMSNARQAIAAAEGAGAADVAQRRLERARALLSSAEVKLHGRNYKGAKDDAVQARVVAVEALEIATRQRGGK